MELSFDEWNVWYQSRFAADPPTEWEHAPRLLEDRYNVTDAVVTGSLLIALLRHCDRVTIACQAQLVNVIAPIMTAPMGPAWRQTIFYPFAHASRYGRGEVLRVEPEAPAAHEGGVPARDAVAVRGADGVVTLFAVNRDAERPLDLAADVRALGACRVLEHLVVADADRTAVNTAEDPGRVRPRPGDATVADGTVRAVLPPISWNVVRLTPESTC